MHPDKNGGTEEAKQRFIQMKERYEALKKRRESGGVSGTAPSATCGSTPDDAGASAGDSAAASGSSADAAAERQGSTPPRRRGNTEVSVDSVQTESGGDYDEDPT